MPPSSVHDLIRRQSSRRSQFESRKAVFEAATTAEPALRAVAKRQPSQRIMERVKEIEQRVRENQEDVFTPRRPASGLTLDLKAMTLADIRKVRADLLCGSPTSTEAPSSGERDMPLTPQSPITPVGLAEAATSLPVAPAAVQLSTEPVSDNPQTSRLSLSPLSPRALTRRVIEASATFRGFIPPLHMAKSESDASGDEMALPLCTDTRSGLLRRRVSRVLPSDCSSSTSDSSEESVADYRLSRRPVTRLPLDVVGPEAEPLTASALKVASHFTAPYLVRVNQAFEALLSARGQRSEASEPDDDGEESSGSLDDSSGLGSLHSEGVLGSGFFTPRFSARVPSPAGSISATDVIAKTSEVAGNLWSTFVTAVSTLRGPERRSDDEDVPLGRSPVLVAANIILDVPPYTDTKHAVHVCLTDHPADVSRRFCRKFKLGRPIEQCITSFLETVEREAHTFPVTIECALSEILAL